MSPVGREWRREPLYHLDPELNELLRSELIRQQETLELIASENFASRAVLEATGSVLTNKYAEGLPGARYYGGCDVVDQVEQLAIDRCKEVFGADHAGRDQLGHLVAVDRVVHGDVFGVGAHVDHLVPQRAQAAHDGLLEREPTVVGAGGDLHGELLLVKTAGARKAVRRALPGAPRPDPRPRQQGVDCISPCAAGPFGPAPAH